MQMKTVCIVGAAGYTGQEALDRVLGHPELELVAVGSDSLAGQPASALDLRLAGAAVPDFVANDAALGHATGATRPIRNGPAMRALPFSSW